MKRMMVFLITIVMMLSFAGCDTYHSDDTSIPSSNDTSIPTADDTNTSSTDSTTIPTTNDAAKTAFFAGRIIEVYGKGYLLKVTNMGNHYFAIDEMVAVDIDNEDWSDFSVGDFIQVEFDKSKPTNYPALIESEYVCSIEQIYEYNVE